MGVTGLSTGVIDRKFDREFQREVTSKKHKCVYGGSYLLMNSLSNDPPVSVESCGYLLALRFATPSHSIQSVQVAHP